MENVSLQPCGGWWHRFADAAYLISAFLYKPLKLSRIKNTLLYFSKKLLMIPKIRL